MFKRTSHERLHYAVFSSTLLLLFWNSQYIQLIGAESWFSSSKSKKSRGNKNGPIRKTSTEDENKCNYESAVECIKSNSNSIFKSKSGVTNQPLSQIYSRIVCYGDEAEICNGIGKISSWNCRPWMGYILIFKEFITCPKKIKVYTK
jgi:hypothetical protein